MREYVRLAAGGRPIEWSVVNDFLKDQHPERELAKTSLCKIAHNSELSRALLTAANKLIVTDGVVRPEEVAALHKIEEMLNA